MTRLQWGESLYESGLDKGVLYLGFTAHPWDGLVSIEEKDLTSTDTTLYFDTKRRRVRQDSGGFQGTVEAYSYPDVFDQYDGYKQPLAGQERPSFGLSYRTQEADGYKIHLVYQARVTPTSASRTSVSGTESVSTFSWDIHTTPVEIPGSRPGSHLVVRTYDARYPEPVAILEDILYGTDSTPARLPSPTELIALFESYTIFRVMYNWDGTFTVVGPDEMVYETEPGTFVLDAPTAFEMEEGAYQVSSY